jgi:hypothetical protein
MFAADAKTYGQCGNTQCKRVPWQRTADGLVKSLPHPYPHTQHVQRLLMRIPHPNKQ